MTQKENLKRNKRKRIKNRTKKSETILKEIISNYFINGVNEAKEKKIHKIH